MSARAKEVFASSVDHLGMTVVDLDRSILFWEMLVSAEVRSRRVVDTAFISEIVGYSRVAIEIATLELPGGLELEMLQYLNRREDAYDPGTAHPGNVHVAFRVLDIAESWSHAVKCGATSVSEGPVEIPSGPRAGRRVAYLRTPDGVTMELVEAGRVGVN